MPYFLHGKNSYQAYMRWAEIRDLHNSWRKKENKVILTPKEKNILLNIIRVKGAQSIAFIGMNIPNRSLSEIKAYMLQNNLLTRKG